MLRKQTAIRGAKRGENKSKMIIAFTCNFLCRELCGPDLGAPDSIVLLLPLVLFLSLPLSPAQLGTRTFFSRAKLSPNQRVSCLAFFRLPVFGRRAFVVAAAASTFPAGVVVVIPFLTPPSAAVKIFVYPTGRSLYPRKTRISCQISCKGKPNLKCGYRNPPDPPLAPTP